MIKSAKQTANKKAQRSIPKFTEIVERFEDPEKLRAWVGNRTSCWACLREVSCGRLKLLESKGFEVRAMIAKAIEENSHVKPRRRRKPEEIERDNELAPKRRLEELKNADKRRQEKWVSVWKERLLDPEKLNLLLKDKGVAAAVQQVERCGHAHLLTEIGLDYVKIISDAIVERNGGTLRKRRHYPTIGLSANPTNRAKQVQTITNDPEKLFCDIIPSIATLGCYLDPKVWQARFQAAPASVTKRFFELMAPYADVDQLGAGEFDLDHQITPDRWGCFALNRTRLALQVATGASRATLLYRLGDWAMGDTGLTYPGLIYYALRYSKMPGVIAFKKHVTKDIADTVKVNSFYLSTYATQNERDEALQILHSLR